MDEDAVIQVATMGTKLEVQVGGEWKRIHGLASTPDFGGQPNTIDSTTLDNTKYESSVQGLMPAVEISYEINVEVLSNPDANLRIVKSLADSGEKCKWRLTKASKTTFEYEAVTSISYNADDQAAIEKFTIYHDLKSDIKVSLPA